MAQKVLRKVFMFRVYLLLFAVVYSTFGPAEAQSPPTFVSPDVLPLGFAGPDPFLSNPVKPGEYIQVAGCAQTVPRCTAAYGYIDASTLSTSAAQGTNSQALAAINGALSELRRNQGRLAEGIALSGAITIMQPNPGDRLFVGLSGANYEGRNAGALSLSYRLNEDTIVFGGYARSENQNLFKGGVGFSIR